MAAWLHPEMTQFGAIYLENQLILNTQAVIYQLNGLVKQALLITVCNQAPIMLEQVQVESGLALLLPPMLLNLIVHA